MNEHTREVRSLNGLRGVAALSVALGHYQVGNLVPAFANLFWWKSAAVDLFFCLSGFTMCLAYRAGEADRLPMRNYLVARAARIYPLYLLSLIACDFIARKPVNITEYQYRYGLWDFVRQMTMTNAWSVIGSGSHSNPPAWSVSVEFFCYLFIFPAVFYGISRIVRCSWLTRLVLSTALVAASCFIFLRYFDWRIFLCGRDPRCRIPEFAYSVDLLRGVLGFAAGWVAYASFLARDRLWAWATRRADLIALGVLAALTAATFGLLPIQVMMLGFPLLLLGVSSGRSYTSRILSWGPIHYLGSISYSIYLLHVPWLDFGKFRAGLFGPRPSDTLWSCLLLLGSMLGVAALSYHYLEMPARRMIRAAWQTPGGTVGSPAGRRVRIAGWGAIAVVVVLVGIGAQRVGVFHSVPALRAEQSG